MARKREWDSALARPTPHDTARRRFAAAAPESRRRATRTELRKNRPTAIAAPRPVAQPKRARTERAGGAAGPQTLPETLDQGHERRVHGAGGSGRGRTCL